MLSPQVSDVISIADYLQDELVSETKHEYPEGQVYAMSSSSKNHQRIITNVEVCRRSEGWVSEHYFMGDEVTFAAIDLTLSVNEIYERVVNDDVSAFFRGEMP